MKKKVLATLLCLAMAATMVVGCGSKAADAPAADAPADDAAAPAESGGGGSFIGGGTVVIMALLGAAWVSKRK